MASATTPWPCPVCAELIPFGFHDCPSCQTTAAWIERILALDFSIRRFHYWSTIGWVPREKYRLIVDTCRQRRDGMVSAAQSGQATYQDIDVTQTECWKCGQLTPPGPPRCPACRAPLDRPEVRHLRYLLFFEREIQRQADAGRLSPAETDLLRKDTQRTLQAMRNRLERE